MLNWADLDKMWFMYWRKRRELFQNPAARAWVGSWLKIISARQKEVGR